MKASLGWKTAVHMWSSNVGKILLSFPLLTHYLRSFSDTHSQQCLLLSISSKLSLCGNFWHIHCYNSFPTMSYFISTIMLSDNNSHSLSVWYTAVHELQTQCLLSPLMLVTLCKFIIINSSILSVLHYKIWNLVCSSGWLSCFKVYSQQADTYILIN
jgi:hypothetical protein